MATPKSPRRLLPHSKKNAPVTQELHRVIADGEHAVAEWASHARAWDGRAYDNDYAVVFRVVDGLIAEVTEYFDPAYMKEVLFSERGDAARPESASSSERELSQPA